MQFAFHRSSRRRLLALWHRGLTLLVCISLLHLPVPVMHRHDEIESADILASHLATCHIQTHSCSLGDEKAEASCECPGIHESHWHFVMPSQRGDDGEPEHGLPHAETEFVVVVNSAVAPANEGSEFEYVCSSVPASCCYICKLDPSSDLQHPCGPAAVAMQVYRCALSCVMRC